MLPSKYEDNTLQIKEKSTERTAPFFCLEVTARSAADILGIHPNSAALFYRKIRTVINHHLALAADEVFEGLSSRTKAISADGVKADVVAGGRKSGCLRHSETQRTGLYRCVNAKSETLLPVIKKKIMPDRLFIPIV
ncbi:putative transposase [Neisseria meningitidis 69176]|nr:putative transposase [Neisseria meningitidis 69176]